MADIRINATGDASGGVAAMDQMGDAVGKSAVKWQEMANAAKFAAKAVVDFVTESVKKYAESERIQKQLVRAAGDYAGAIDEQSKALSRLYAVDDDVINQSAILLTQWGGVGAATKDVEVAALNLASAMGGDLNTATSDLIRNVESGGVGLAKMGIHFKATGDKGHDLAAAVAAINEKLGGAAGADAASLTGQLHAASIAFEDLQKSIGGGVATWIEQNGIIGRLTEAMRGLNAMLNGPEDHIKADELRLQNQEHLLANLEQRKQLLAGIAEIESHGGESPASKAMVAHLDENIAKLKEILRLDSVRIQAGDLAAPGVKDKTNKGLKSAASAAKGKTQGDLDDASLANAKEYQRGLDAIDAHAEERSATEQARMWKTAEEEEKAREERGRGAFEFDKKMAKEEDDRHAAHDKEAAKLEEQALKDQSERATKQAHAAQAAGDAIGAAMVNALSEQLSKLAEGGEFDAAAFISEILAAAVGVAGSVIGTALGQPAVGAAIGNLAAMGIRAGGSAISKGNKSNKARTMHDGGWVDAPRHHDGSWIGEDERRAILQTGERVLSRQEVGNMGGARGVDSAARGGGGGLTLNVSTMDAKSMADTFSGAGGDALKQALRRGHGSLPGVFARSPR